MSLRKTKTNVESEGQLKELSHSINGLYNSVISVGECLQPLLQASTADVAAEISPLQRAKLDLISLYAANSLFWVYLKTKGINPIDHNLSKELDRVKTHLQRLKQLEDAKHAPKVNKEASKRVLRNALWSSAHAKGESSTQTNDSSTAALSANTPAAASCSSAADGHEPAAKAMKKDSTHKLKQKTKSSKSGMKSKKQRSKGKDPSGGGRQQID